VGGTGPRRLDLRLIAATAGTSRRWWGRGRSARPVLPRQRHPDPHSAAAGAPGGPGRDRRGVPRAALRRHRRAEAAAFRRTPRDSPRVSLAGNGPRTAERARAGGGDVAPRGAAAGTFPGHLLRLSLGVRGRRLGGGRRRRGGFPAKGPGSLASVESRSGTVRILSALAAVGGNRRGRRSFCGFTA